ncbi:hypothetical protein Bca101_017547 [Brassica carinata]
MTSVGNWDHQSAVACPAAVSISSGSVRGWVGHCAPLTNYLGLCGRSAGRENAELTPLSIHSNFQVPTAAATRLLGFRLCRVIVLWLLLGKQGPDCCKWRGVLCDSRTSHVIKIDLRNPNQKVNFDEYQRSCLGGKIHPSLTRLKFLSYLDLSSNDFNGLEIPEFIGHMVSLRYLNLSLSLFSGEVPATLGKFSKLESLDLNTGLWPYFDLYASSLGWLSGLSSSLTYLDMGYVILRVDQSNNHLTGEIPAVRGELPQLKYLDLSENSFQGQIHRFFDAFSKVKNKRNSLVYLNLGSNGLNGTLPESLGALRNLQTLCLSSNSFTGSIPSSVGNMTSLKKLNLSISSMNFGKLEELVDLNLMDNKWEGVLLKSHFVNLRSLKRILLTTEPYRSLVINLPSTWVPPFRLEEINIENCQIGPSFPMWLQVQNKLNSVTLRNNGIADKIPYSWFAGIASHNNFSGSLPLNIDVLMPRVERIDLFHHSFTGEIPSSLCEVTTLETLNLGNNRFSGSIPKCWRGSSKLYEIDASENNISGEIPESLCDIPDLIFLHLNQNAFEGNITNMFPNCLGIEDVDLSGNNIKGEIPAEIFDLLIES